MNLAFPLRVKINIITIGDIVPMCKIDIIFAACAPVMTKKANQCVLGLTEQGTAGDFTEETCVSGCLESLECKSCDWVNEEKTCWFGTKQNPKTLDCAQANHFDKSHTGSCGK